MRICYVATYPPIECGIASYTQFLNEEISKKHETYVVSQMGAKGKNVLPVYWPHSTSIATEVFLAASRITPDLVHIQHEFGIFGIQRGVQVTDLVLRLKMARIPVVATLHTVYSEPTLEEETVLGVMLRECASVIVHEAYQKKTLLRCFGEEWEKKIHVIPHGVRVATPSPEAKKAMGLAGKKVILMCGYYRINKQFHKIIELWPQISRKVKNAVLVLAGKTQLTEYSDYPAQLAGAIDRCPEKDSIQVLEGQFPQKIFDTIISAADIGVMPYTFGGQSGILSHFYALNKPVVVSDLEAFAESLEQSKGGLIARTDEDYPELIAKILNQPSLYSRMQKDIRNYVRAKCLWKVVAERHEPIYQKILPNFYKNSRRV